MGIRSQPFALGGARALVSYRCRLEAGPACSAVWGCRMAEWEWAGRSELLLQLAQGPPCLAAPFCARVCSELAALSFLFAGTFCACAGCGPSAAVAGWLVTNTGRRLSILSRICAHLLRSFGSTWRLSESHALWAWACGRHRAAVARWPSAAAFCMRDLSGSAYTLMLLSGEQILCCVSDFRFSARS